MREVLRRPKSAAPAYQAWALGPTLEYRLPMAITFLMMVFGTNDSASCDADSWSVASPDGQRL